MLRTARLIAVCMLLLAVPVKGAVAVSMVMCGPGHDRSAATVAAQPIGHASHHHEGDSAGQAAGGEQGGDPTAHDHESAAKHGAVKCSICAACCVGGAALASSAMVLPASAGAEAPFPALDVHFPWTAIAGLERPPRSLLV